MVEATGERSNRTAEVSIGRERFLAMVVGSLNDVLGDTVGPREVEGFVNLVGMAVAEQILARYLAAAGTSRLDLSATLDALLDWNRDLGGDIAISERSEKKVVLDDRRCPFLGFGLDSRTMCRMTAHVVGHMVAESQGYGRVTLADRASRGSRGCRIVIDLEPDACDGGGQSYYAKGGR
ncbi:methanogen output domain 1-containing protein [Methylobacterium komagatae]